MKIGDRLGLPCFKRFTPPENDYLIGWYKFNEGSGLVVNNYATGGDRLPDLDVVNYDGTFWTYLVGFGSSPTFSWCNFTRANLGATINFGPDCGWGYFYRPTFYTGGYFLGVIRGSIGDDPYDHGFGNQVFCGEGKFMPRSFWRLNGVSVGILNQNEWGFLFQNRTGIYLVNSNGILNTKLRNISDVRLFQYLNVGAATGNDAMGINGASGSYADLLIYNNVSPDLTQWAQWYDQLRSRYGMAARSGW